MSIVVIACTVGIFVGFAIRIFVKEWIAAEEEQKEYDDDFKY